MRGNFAFLIFAAVSTSLGASLARAGITQRVSVSSTGVQGNGKSNTCDMSADGRLVVFDSGASSLVTGDSNGAWDTFVHDRNSHMTERVSVSMAGGQTNGGSGEPTISGDGRFVAFQSFANNLVPGDTNGKMDIFVRDGLAGTTERVSVSSDGGQANDLSEHATISADGRYVAFLSSATNLVAGGTNGRYHAFVRDRLAGTTECVSVSSAGEQGNNDAIPGGGWGGCPPASALTDDMWPSSLWPVTW
jgi:Tol biopolymer transport system component